MQFNENLFYHGVFNTQSKKFLTTIISYYEQNYQRHTMIVPSARFGLYVTAKTVFRPGDRIILSPISCRTVLYALLAAGVIPVFVDINLDCGNIDFQAIPIRTLKAAKGIITTNLYGQPDHALGIKRLADKYGLFMIEDCAHVLASYINGRRIGTIGNVSVFSFKKYFHESGGAICSCSRELHERIASVAVRECRLPSPVDECVRLIQFWLKRNGLAQIESATKFLYRKMSFAENNKKQHDTTSGAVVPEGKVDYDSLLAVSNPDYKKFPNIVTLGKVAHNLVQESELTRSRISNDHILIEKCPLEYKTPEYETTVCHLVVPFFAQNRDGIVEKVKREKGIPTWYMYKPPLCKIMAQWLLPHDTCDPGKLEHWYQHILPIDSAFAQEYLTAIESFTAPEPG